MCGPVLAPSGLYSVLLWLAASEPPHGTAVAQAGICKGSCYVLMAAGPCHTALPALSCDKKLRVTQANQTQDKWMGDFYPSESTPEFSKVEGASDIWKLGTNIGVLS